MKSSHIPNFMGSERDAKDIKIARRTVAKYREALGILATNLRRRYH